MPPPACKNLRELASKFFPLFKFDFSEADCRMKIRLDSSAKSRLVMGVAFAVPFATYMLYGFLAPSGVMQNHRAS